MPSKKVKQAQPAKPSHFQILAAAFPGSGRVVLGVLCFLALFAFLCALWALPFPKFRFMGQYAGYINWASFGIAAAVYYYYRCHKTLSYYLLLLTMGASYLITLLSTRFNMQSIIIAGAAAVVLTGVIWFAWFRFSKSRAMPPFSFAILNGWQAVFNKPCTKEQQAAHSS